MERTSLLALGVATASCGAQTGSVVGDGPSASISGASEEGASEEAAPSNTTPLSAAQVDAAAFEPRLRPLVGGNEGAAWRVIEVPTAMGAPVLVSSPLGWLALSSRPFGDVEAPSGYENALYRSTDGIHWTSLPLGGDDSVQLQGLAYGAGRSVMSGVRHTGSGPESIAWSSSDGLQWTESPGAQAGPVEYAHGRFFQVGFNFVVASEDGIDWRSTPIRLLQEGGVAYGNGIYVLAANGPLQSSTDGWSWQEHPLDCNIPGLGAGYGQCYHRTLLFAEGHFYTEELSSADGASWQAEPGRRPVAYDSGVFLGSPSLSEGLPTWVSGGELQLLRLVRTARAAVTVDGRAEGNIGLLDRQSPLPSTVSVEFEDGLTCDNATCLLVGGRLLLVPPTGTPPLVDHVPRTADGAPLLSDSCPVSNQIWCDDYATRSGCVCHPDAPRAPAYCQDVSQYRCVGHFTQRSGEWQLDEVADGGCSCDAVDPNQPPGFGLDCGDGKAACNPSLQCLSIDPRQTSERASGGGLPPAPRRSVCTDACKTDADCPSWQATGFCAGAVQLRCSHGACQPRSCP